MFSIDEIEDWNPVRLEPPDDHPPVSKTSYALVTVVHHVMAFPGKNTLMVKINYSTKGGPIAKQSSHYSISGTKHEDAKRGDARYIEQSASDPAADQGTLKRVGYSLRPLVHMFVMLLHELYDLAAISSGEQQPRILYRSTFLGIPVLRF